MQVVPKLKNSAPGPNYAPFFGYFVMPEIELVKIYSLFIYTKFDVCNYTHSRFTEVGLKCKNAPNPD